MAGRRGVRVVLGAGFATVAATVMAVGLAWACTGQPLLSLAGDAAHVRPGSEVVATVHGTQSASAMQLHWNAVDGPVLATATPAAGATTDVRFAVPAASPGVYYLVLTAGAEGVGRTALEVTGTAPAGAGRAPWGSAEARTEAGTAGQARSSSFLAGAWLFALGLVSLSAFAVVAAGRRRVLARTGDS